jgi:hypothetical protein
MLKLFAVYLGGRSERCNIELHDVVFVVCESIQQSYPALVNKWFGITKLLHVDAYIELTHADGHEIMISKECADDTKKLFYVNFGSYKNDYFGEIHESKFYVGTTKSEVLMRAKEELCLNGVEPHCDDNLLVDDIIEVNEVDQYYLHFVEAEPRKMTIIPEYQRLDLPEILHQSGVFTV